MPRSRFLQAGLLACTSLSLFTARPAHAQLSFLYQSFQPSMVNPSVDLDAGSFAAGISANGTIVGSYADSDIILHGYVRSPNGVYTKLDYTPTAPSPYPFSGNWMFGGINNAGDVTGQYQYYNIQGNFTSVDSFIYHNGIFSRPQVAGATTTLYDNVNEAGLVATSYIGTDKNKHGAIYNLATSSFTLLPDIAGYKDNFVQTVLPNGAIVRNLGNGVTDSVTGDELLTGSITLNGVTTYFNFPGAVDTRLDAVTSTGLYVGNYLDASHNRYGFVYDTVNSKPYPINGDTNAIFTTLYFSNNANQFVGYWYDNSYVYHSLIVTAVPEPGSVALLVGLSVVGAGFLRRKTRKVRAC